MELTWHKSQSTVIPDEVDTTSSKTTVYIRKNVTEVEETNVDENGELTKTGRIMYEYDEAKLTKAEYLVYLSDKANDEANIANQLAIAELAEANEQSLIDIQLAIAELAESMASASESEE